MSGMTADLPDSNVWVVLATDRHRHHPAARDWFNRFPTTDGSGSAG